MAPSGTEQRTGEPRAASPGEKLVLIVEDDESQLDLLDYLVRREGFRSRRAVAGRQALHVALERRPDLILLDLMLPEMGGYDLLLQLQADGLGGVPVVIVTARILAPETTEAFLREPNVRELVAKPYNPAAMAALLHALLKTRPPAPRQP
jgi:DNA-binding response OmpR family regulator